MTAYVIGCGSIGQRRALILAGLGIPVVVVDKDKRKAQRFADKHLEIMALGVRDWWAAVRAHEDIVLICTPPETHFELAVYVVDLEPAGLYIEKPLAVLPDLWESVVEETERRGIITMGACNLRFVEHIDDLRPEDNTVIVYRMGQHEKYWSPKHQKQTMILDSIHELDLARAMQGPITKVLGWSDLDEAEVWLSHEGGGQSKIILDRFTDPPVRHIATGTGRILANLWPPDLTMYVREMTHFIAAVQQSRATCNPLRQALETLVWARVAVKQG